MMGNRMRHRRLPILAVCLLLSALFLLLTVFAAIPENGNNTHSRERSSNKNTQHPIADAITDGVDAVGDAAKNAGNAVGEAVSDVGDAVGNIVSDAGNAVGDAADAIDGHNDRQDNAVTDNAGGAVGGSQSDPSTPGVMPYDSHSAVTPENGSTAGTTVTENRTGSFNWIWILILTAAAAAIFFLLLMPNRRRET